jgi:hypothetical protein
MAGIEVKRLVFLCFAAAILFSMVREWNAPVACVRTVLVPSAQAQAKP